MIANCKTSRQVRRALKRTEKKKIRTQEKAEMQQCKEINCLLKKVFPDKNQLIELAIEKGFYIRQRNLLPCAFVSVLLISCIDDINTNPATLEKMCMSLEKWFKIYIKPQSLKSRINSAVASRFVKTVMELTIKYFLNKSIKKLFPKKRFKINLFSRLLIQDSTIISLPDSLSRIFRGCGGTSSKAAIKIDFIIDQNSRLILRVKCTSGRTNDGKMAKDIIEILDENDLVLRDLGYFNLSDFLKIGNKKGYFISRLTKNTQIYLTKEGGNPIDIHKYLTKLGIKNKNIDINIYVGKNERIPLRLIGIKVPAEVVEQRKEQYKKKNHGRCPSEALKEWNKFTLMITNIDKEKLNQKTIINLYRLRWQIELFFKSMKSNLHVDKITGSNKYRIMCLIFSKIILVWISSILYAYAQSIVKDKYEISLPKFIDWLKDGRLKEAIVLKDFENFIHELERDKYWLCKQKRRLKTSLERLDDGLWIKAA